MDRLKHLHKSTVEILRKHYMLLVFVCFIAGMLGIEFSFSTTAIKARMGGEANSISSMEKVVKAMSLEPDRIGKMPLVVLDILSGEQNDAENVVDTIISMVRTDDVNAELMDYTKKTITALTNITSGGQAIVMISTYIFKSGVDGDFLRILIIFCAFVIYEIVVCLILDVYKVVYRRVVLESRIYHRIFSTRFLFLIKVKCWFKVGFAIVVKNILYMLWCFTIVGAFVKRYSYYMVPYILAENPQLKPMEAISLSRKMMNGHKMECFLYDLSFLPLSLLDMVTLGVTGIFITNPYKAAFFAEYYAEIRNEALISNVCSEKDLPDKYLFDKADDQLLSETYSDLNQLEEKVKEPIEAYKGFRKVLASVLGVSLYSDDVSENYARRQSDRLHLNRMKIIVSGEAYPNRLSKLEKIEGKKWIDELTFNRNYSVLSIILMFFAGSMIGWFWEVLLHLIQTGEFVNRGSMYGPWLPIYGSGGMLILMVLNRLRNHPIILFISAMTLCGTVEYFTSYYLEKVYGIQWWNYDGYFLNLDGRICAEGVMAFGILGLAGVYVICPALDAIFKRGNKKVLWIIAAILILCFTGDKIYTDQHPHVGKGITVQEDENESADNNSFSLACLYSDIWVDTFDIGNISG